MEKDENCPCEIKIIDLYNYEIVAEKYLKIIQEEKYIVGNNFYMIDFEFRNLIQF